MITIPWWAASFAANIAIIATEYLNRSAAGGWATVLPKTAPLIILAQWCLFMTWRDAPHWLVAWMVFTIGNALARTTAVGLYGVDGIGNWGLVIAGVTGMVGSAFILKQGLA